MSFTLTLTDEENIRQRLLEIRKTKLKRERVSEVEVALTDKFERETDKLGERNRAKEEEQKILLTRQAKWLPNKVENPHDLERPGPLRRNMLSSY